MSEKKSLAQRLQAGLGEALLDLRESHGETTIEVAPSSYLDVARRLRDEFGFAQLVDLSGVDYLGYGDVEWDVSDVSAEGFSRGVEGQGPGRFSWEERPIVDMERRFAVAAHLLSLIHNERLRLKVFAPAAEVPVVPSVTEVWNGADWYEREAFDLYGIIFEGHPDLRRLLTDYGFVGHPFRKDFPLIGNVEVRYDADRRRVIYQPTSIEPRVLVPRVIRDDSRYADKES